jgi:S1-C subfamily serine protease
VVRIYCTSQEPDYDAPWQARMPTSGTGSGVVVAPGRVLTGAHVVANATFVQVQKISDPNKVVVRVAGICHDCDLALLAVDDPRFMEGVEIASLGELPDLRDPVAVAGFPVGGEEVSITEGVVSRIEVTRYSHSQRHLLAITVDAAINRGNSGGPVFRDGRIVGIAFQKLGNAEGIGEMVPPPLIKHFLAEVERNGAQVRVPGLGITTQGLENPFLRRRVGVEGDDGGILVLNVEYGNSAYGHILPGDVVLEIEGQRIASNATIQLLGNYRTRYDAALGWKRIGDPIEITLLRQGARRRVRLELTPLKLLVARNQYDVEPSYFIFGGLVFQPLTRDFLATWDNWWDKAPKEFLHYYYSGTRTAERQEVVVLSHVLAEETNVGYEGLYSESVTLINGHPPRDMIDFVRRVEESSDLVEIRTSCDGVIVLGVDAARKANQRILERYRIATDRSPHLST